MIFLIVPQVIISIQTIIGRLSQYQQNVADFITEFLKDKPELQVQADEILGNIAVEFED